MTSTPHSRSKQPSRVARRTKRARSSKLKELFFGRFKKGLFQSRSLGPAAAVRSTAAYLLFAVVAGAPFPFGSVDPRATALWCIVLGVAAIMLAVTAAVQLEAGKPQAAHFQTAQLQATQLQATQLQKGHLVLLAGVLLIVALYAFVLHEQLSDHPWIATANPIWSKSSELLGSPLNPSVSITRGEPVAALGPALANVLALVCGLFVGTDERRARQLLWVIAWSAGAYALYGILSFFIEPTMILWRDKRYYVGSVTGTFVNRNTAAAYFGSGAVIWLCLLLHQIRRKLPPGSLTWTLVRKQALSNPPRLTVISFSIFFVCLTAMFLTVSRAGIVLSLFALVLTFALYFRKDLPPGKGKWIALGSSILGAVALLQFFGGAVGSRFGAQGLDDEGRFEVYRATLRMIADHPWFGSGLGTFPWSFQPYRSPELSMSGLWDIAHNTPLELAAELGLPLALLVTLGWGAILWVLIVALRARPRGRIVPLAALSVASLALLHSCIDFTLQIPGYSIIMFAIVGAGLGVSLSTAKTA